MGKIAKYIKNRPFERAFSNHKPRVKRWMKRPITQYTIAIPAIVWLGFLFIAMVLEDICLTSNSEDM